MVRSGNEPVRTERFFDIGITVTLGRDDLRRSRLEAAFLPQDMAFLTIPMPVAPDFEAPVIIAPPIFAPAIPPTAPVMVAKLLKVAIPPPAARATANIGLITPTAILKMSLLVDGELVCSTAIKAINILKQSLHKPTE